MALGRSRRRENRMDYWPGFVDALSTLLLAIMFLLSVFVLAQYILTQEVTSKDDELNELYAKINELTALFSLEQSAKQDLQDSLITLQANLEASEKEKSRLQSLFEEKQGTSNLANERAQTLEKSLDEEKKLSKKALSQVELLNQQISALRRQIAALEDALDASESKDRESRTKITELTKRLNIALAKRVQELARYRSDFFGRLREILSDRSDIRIVGDRFVFQSEVLFGSGDNVINDQGKGEMDKLAEAALQLEREIPQEINWVIRVDGHTDNIPLSGNGQFKNNWELSAARAVSVVQYLISKGVQPTHLVAAGFGEFHPLVEEDTDEARAKNRRIELKLTER